jgi:Ca-activated chloride channel family protein
VRVEEFVNYFRFPYRAEGDAAFVAFCNGGPSPFGPSQGGERLELLKITVKARELREDERRTAILTFAVDTSGSMAAGTTLQAGASALPQGRMSAASRLALVRTALRTLVEALRSEDRVGIVAYSTHPVLVLPHTPARERGRILGAIDSLEPSGATNVEAGLDLAYRVADEVFEPKALNRVIWCSDGVANMGARGPEEILKKVQVFARRGIYLSSVGFGMSKYDDKLLETLANKGNGHYDHVDSEQEAQNIFQRDLPSTLQVLAEDAKIQVEFRPEVVRNYRLLGYENRDIRDEDFRNDKVDAGEVGPGSTVTVLYEIRRRANPRGELGRIFIRYRDTHTRRVEELDYPLSPGVLQTKLSKTPEEFRFLACVAELAELLRGSYWSRDGSYGKVLEVLGTLSPEFQARPEWQEVVELTLRAQALTLRELAGTK